MKALVLMSRYESDVILLCLEIANCIFFSTSNFFVRVGVLACLGPMLSRHF